MRWLVLLGLILAPLVHAESLLLAFSKSPPYSDVDDSGQPIGMNYEIARMLAAELQVELKVINCPFARCLTLMSEGNADLMLGLFKNEERQRYLHFIEPPYYAIQSPVSFYKLKQHDIRITEYAQLEPYMIGVLRGGAYFDRFDRDENIIRVELPSVEKQIELLLKGRVDLVIGVGRTFPHRLANMGLDEQVDSVEFKHVRSVGAHMALSKKSRFVARSEAFSDAVVALRGQEKLARLLLEYGIYTKDSH